MRTLDEVIEIASDWTNGFDEMSIEKQMLHYLKMYRSDQIQWEADREDWRDKWESYIEARERHLDAVKELKRNDLLTWDELRTMEGKPVWVEDNIDEPDDTTKYWAIYRRIDKAQETEYALLSDFFYDKAQYGKTWKAYRKERS